MYSKERLLNNSSFSKFMKAKGRSIKGVLSKKETEEHFKGSVSVITNVETQDFFFTDDYCLGVDYLPDVWVPSATRLPCRVVPREILPVGIIDTVDKYISIFHKDGRLIETVEELIDILNKKDTPDLKDLFNKLREVTAKGDSLTQDLPVGVSVSSSGEFFYIKYSLGHPTKHLSIESVIQELNTYVNYPNIKEVGEDCFNGRL